MKLNEILNKIKKKRKITLLVSLAFLVISIVLVCLGYKYENQALPEPVSMNDLLAKDKLDLDKYAYVDVSTKPYLFASYEDNLEKFYFVMDDNNLLYILYMNSTSFNRLNKDDLKTTRVYGITEEIPSDLKKIAISSYNELMKEEYLDDTNFKDYVGLMYLNVERSYYDASLYYLGFIFCLMMFLIIIIAYFINLVKIKNNLKKYGSLLDNISNELSVSNNTMYEKYNLYLTNNYLIDANGRLLIIDYKEIENVYKYEYRYNGITTSKSLKIKTNNKKTYDILSMGLKNKEADKIHDDVIKFLQEKNNNIVIGYKK